MEWAEFDLSWNTIYQRAETESLQPWELFTDPKTKTLWNCPTVKERKKKFHHDEYIFMPSKWKLMFFSFLWLFFEHPGEIG